MDCDSYLRRSSAYLCDWAHVMKTQKQRILEALKHWTSPADAFRQAGTMKLATRVGELRAEGYDIEDKWIDRDYKMYRLRPQKPQTKWVK